MVRGGTRARVHRRVTLTCSPQGEKASGPWLKTLDERGFAYWYNRVTRETTWIDPAQSVSPKVLVRYPCSSYPTPCTVLCAVQMSRELRSRPFACLLICDCDCLSWSLVAAQALYVPQGRRVSLWRPDSCLLLTDRDLAPQPEEPKTHSLVARPKIPQEGEDNPIESVRVCPSPL